MNSFNFKDSTVYRAFKKEKFFLFYFAGFLKDFFLVLFIISLLLTGLSFVNLASGYYSLKAVAVFFALFVIFWNLDLFLRFKIKKSDNGLTLDKNLQDLQNYNLAEFLDFGSAKIVDSCISFCNSKKIPLNSSALFYCATRASKDVSLICFRLGMDPKKLQISLKNYLEKFPKQQDFAGKVSEDFIKTIESAISLAKIKQKKKVGEKEILVGLAKEDPFLKQAMIEFDLKPQDVESLTLWLDSAELMLEKNKKFWTKESLAKNGSLGKDWSSGYTVTLDKFSIDWRRAVSKWRYREIIGHKKEIEQTEVILARSDLANVLIVGDPGTGRKSIVEALAQKCFLGTSLPQLNNKRVVELDLVMLAAKIPDFERLEFELDQIFSEAAASENVILVVDDLENFINQKTQRAGAFDISGVLSKYLLMPSFKFIGITSYDGLHNNIEENSSFAGHFQKVEVSEISESETINVLQTSALDLEYRYKVLVLYPSIREIVNLTARYIPSLPFPKKALDVLNEAVIYVQRLKEKIVLPHHVAEIISKKTDIPVGKMEAKEKETLLNLENLIHQRIVNQEEAVREISTAMRRARSGISSKNRPMGTFLFLGPTGVGKTETAKALANIYFGSETKMIRLDMSEFQLVSDIARLIGAPSPVSMQGLLTTPIRETPFSLVLLDEIEKAHPNILNLFLQVLDEGYITDGQGRKVVFSNTIIICTSNAGADMIFEQVKTGTNLDKNKLFSALFLKKIFKPEFINRFDASVIFHPLTKENLMDIAQLSLQRLKNNLKEKEIDFEITKELKQKIVELSYKPEFGAREMRRVVQDKVEAPVAEALISDKIKRGDKIEIDPVSFEVLIIS